jgi:hypothetical protein
MTARDLFDRANILEEYIDTLHKAHSDCSNWNEELGEGNPVARSLKDIRAEYQNELNEIMEKLDQIKV